MLIIKNGTLVFSNKTCKADIAVEDSIIVCISDVIDGSIHDELYDATGCYVFPGFIDGHTHLDLDTGETITADDFLTGTKAALVGGTTTIVDFATQNKGGTLKEAYDSWMNKAQGKSSCNYRFHMAITDWNEEIRKELHTMPAMGVTSFKMYMAYDNLKANDEDIYECLKEVKKINGVLGVHCENGELIHALTKEAMEVGKLDVTMHPKVRPDSVEAEAINRLCYIGKLADYPVNVVHLSSVAGLSEVRKARDMGIFVGVETCPQYLLLQDDVYNLPKDEGLKYVLAPPLRKKKDCLALTQAVINGEVDTIATDHCSFNFQGQKDIGKENFTNIPNGLPGIEHRVILMYDYLVVTHKMEIEEFCELLSCRAAKKYGMFPQKGILQEGSDADIVIFDPATKQKITASKQTQNVDYTPYEGRCVQGSIKAVFLGGKKVVENGVVLFENQGIYAKDKR